MPINVGLGSRWPAGTLCGAQVEASSDLSGGLLLRGKPLPSPAHYWPGAGWGLRPSLVLMQLLPASSWLGAPGLGSGARPGRKGLLGGPPLPQA
jgi:hypothetical protein